jgi:hypothetical protein
MWNWLNCHLSGRHDYGMWCEPGTIFLRCMHCGKRSSGWSVEANVATPVKKQLTIVQPPKRSRVLPFGRLAR